MKRYSYMAADMVERRPLWPVCRRCGERARWAIETTSRVNVVRLDATVVRNVQMTSASTWCDEHMPPYAPKTQADLR